MPATATVRDHSFLREVIISPYLRGRGPRFRLRTWDSGRRDSRGTTTIRYELAALESGKPASVLFAGADFNASPMYADDSDKAIAALMSFLTLKPGDTDDEYFDNYTPKQLAFAHAHGEALACECLHRFGED